MMVFYKDYKKGTKKYTMDEVCDMLAEEIESIHENQADSFLKEPMKNLIISMIAAAKESIEEKEKARRGKYYDNISKSESVALIDDIVQECRKSRMAMALIEQYIAGEMSRDEIEHYLMRERTIRSISEAKGE